MGNTIQVLPSPFIFVQVSFPLSKLDWYVEHDICTHWCLVTFPCCFLIPFFFPLSSVYFLFILISSFPYLHAALIVPPGATSVSLLEIFNGILVEIARTTATLP